MYRIVTGGIRVSFYDVTTLYFEASSEDDLRKVGFSKDGKFTEPQIILGLLTSLEGYPLDRKSTRLNSSHITRSRMPSSA